MMGPIPLQAAEELKLEFCIASQLRLCSGIPLLTPFCRAHGLVPTKALTAFLFAIFNR